MSENRVEYLIQITKLQVYYCGITETTKKINEELFKSLKECITSRMYIIHVMWMCIALLRLYYYTSSFNMWLQYVTGNDKAAISQLTNVAMYIQFGGVLASISIGLLMDFERKRHRDKDRDLDRIVRPVILPLTVASSLGVLVSVATLISHPIALYFAFVLFVMSRGMMMGLITVFVQIIFPVQYFGTLIGVATVSGGIFTLLQYPLIEWHFLPPFGPFKVNLFLLALTSLTYIHPLVIWYTCRKVNDDVTDVRIARTETANGITEKKYVHNSKISPVSSPNDNLFDL